MDHAIQIKQKQNNLTPNNMAQNSLTDNIANNTNLPPDSFTQQLNIATNIFNMADVTQKKDEEELINIFTPPLLLNLNISPVSFIQPPENTPNLKKNNLQNSPLIKNNINNTINKANITLNLALTIQQNINNTPTPHNTDLLQNAFIKSISKNLTPQKNTPQQNILLQKEAHNTAKTQQYNLDLPPENNLIAPILSQKKTPEALKSKNTKLEIFFNSTKLDKTYKPREDLNLNSISDLTPEKLNKIIESKFIDPNHINITFKPPFMGKIQLDFTLKNNQNINIICKIIEPTDSKLLNLVRDQIITSIENFSPHTKINNLKIESFSLDPLTKENLDTKLIENTKLEQISNSLFADNPRDNNNFKEDINRDNFNNNHQNAGQNPNPDNLNPKDDTREDTGEDILNSTLDKKKTRIRKSTKDPPNINTHRYINNIQKYNRLF